MVGTKNGLNRLDFSQEQIKRNKTIAFQRFFYDSSKTNSLSNNSINSIYQDRRGQLWIGTHNGLNRLDLESYSKSNNPTFVHYFNDPKDSNSISHKAIKAIVGDDKGNLWIGTLGGGLNKVDLKPVKFYFYRNDPMSQNSILDNYVLSLIEDHSGNLWIGNNKGVDRVDNTTGEYTHYKFYQDNSKDKYFPVHEVFEDSENNLWAGTFGQGLYKFNKQKNLFEKFKLNVSNSKTTK